MKHKNRTHFRYIGYHVQLLKHTIHVTSRSSVFQSYESMVWSFRNQRSEVEFLNGKIQPVIVTAKNSL